MRYELYFGNFDYANDCDEIEDRPHFMTSTLELAKKVVQLWKQGKFDNEIGKRYGMLLIFDIETGEFVEED